MLHHAEKQGARWRSIMLANDQHYTAAALAAAQIRNSFPTLPAFVPFTAACAFMGIARQTGDHWLRAGTFPIPVSRLGNRKYGVPLVGLQLWLIDQLEASGYPRGELQFVAPQPVLHAGEVTQKPDGTGLLRPPHKRGRGRPRKIQQPAEQVAA